MREASGNRVLELAALLCDELITAEQFAELDEILGSDGEARAAYRGFLALHQRLQNGALEANHDAVMTEPAVSNPEPSVSVFRAVGTAPGLAVPDPAHDGGKLEGRIRKAERRAMWSMAACLVGALFLIVLLFRPRLETRMEESGTGMDSARKMSASDRELGSIPIGAPALPGAGDLPDVPPPPPPPGGERAPVGSVADAGQTEEATGGFLIRNAAVNDIFQMLAKQAGKQYFHNSKVAGPEFKVSGHLNAGDPMEQMEELAFAHGLTVVQKGNTVYALNEEQRSQLPTEKLNYPFRSVRPADIDKVKEVIQPMLSPTGIASYEPETNSITIVDSAHQVERARDLLAALDGPKGQAVGGKEEENAELGREGDRQDLSTTAEEMALQEITARLAELKSSERGGQDGERIASLREQLEETNRDLNELQVRLDSHSESFRPMTVKRGSAATTNLGQHSDGSSWEDTSIAGGGRAGREATSGSISLDRLASRKGIALSGASTVGGVSDDSFFEVIPPHEDYEAEIADYFPLSAVQDSSLLAALPLGKNADNTNWDTLSDEETAKGGAGARLTQAEIRSREQALLRATLNQSPNSATRSMSRRERPLADAEEAAGEGQAEATFSLIDRVPLITSTINESAVSNNVTEEVRYSVDSKDPGGDPATTREIGVTMAVTPTLLPDGTIQMKMRPRSAQKVEEIVGQSGNRYPRVSESMLESIARVPEGHSVVLGGFYGEVKKRDGNKVPLLGDIPEIGFFFKGKEAAKEPASLLFVATPTSINGKVVTEVKILSVNSSVGEREGVDWSASLGEAGVSRESIGSLNSLFGIENAIAGAGGAIAASDGPIVLSPAQTKGVLRALSSGGLVTQTSSPTIVAEANPAVNQEERVPGGVAKREDDAKVPANDDQSGRASALLKALGNQLRSAEEGAPTVSGRVGSKSPVRKEVSPTVSRAQESLKKLEREREVLKQLEKNAGDEPYSTFSLNVSDVSFKLARAALARGEWPAADQVRVEEFVNAFDYGDPAPSQNEKVACKLEQAAHPFLQQRNLLRVSMKTAALGRAADTPLRLTVLLDNSGSMERADRAESVKNAFRLLAGQLNPRDQVTLIGFARTTRLLADRLAGDKVAELAKVVESTPIEGGTNLEQALELGIAKAKEQLLEGGQNRIILLTDGAANLGNAKPEDLAKLVDSMRQQGIAFDACGVGADGLNDDILESLTRKGDGRYYFLDRPEDADEGFARQIAGALRPAARNVKVQVNFNPERVGRYKLYGFEKHRLKKEDFRNDSVDAAELAAEEAGNAIYHLEFLPEGSGEIGTVSVRFQDTESGQMIERQWTIPYEAQAPRLEDSTASLRLASGAALLGEKLKGSALGESVEMARLEQLMYDLTDDFPSSQRVVELVQMTSKARELLGE